MREVRCDEGAVFSLCLLCNTRSAFRTRSPSEKASAKDRLITSYQCYCICACSYRWNGHRVHRFCRGDGRVERRKDDKMKAESVEHEEVPHVTIAEDDGRESKKDLLDGVEHVDRSASFLYKKGGSALARLDSAAEKHSPDLGTPRRGSSTRRTWFGTCRAPRRPSRSSGMLHPSAYRLTRRRRGSSGGSGPSRRA